MNYTPEQCKIICEMAYQYVYKMVVDTGKSENEATQVLERYKPEAVKGHKSLSEIYQHFCHHAQNTAYGGNAIRVVFGASWQPARQDRWQKFVKLVQQFNPHEFVKTYPSFAEFKQAVYDAYPEDVQKGFTETVSEYMISVFELGHFFAKFPEGESVYTEFDKYYNPNPTSLIRYLEGIQGIENRAFFGMRYALLADALKEMGGDYDYVKPDDHIKDIAKGLDISKSDDASHIAQDVQSVADNGGIMSRYELDKYLFLIGSGQFYRDDDLTAKYAKKGNEKRKSDFIKLVLDVINS